MFSTTGIKYQQGIYKIEVTADYIALTVVKYDNNTEIHINSVVQGPATGYCKLHTKAWYIVGRPFIILLCPLAVINPRTTTTIHLQSTRRPFGECRYVTSTIGHPSGARQLVASIVLLMSVAVMATLNWL